jgi:hypothetical protein
MANESNLIFGYTPDEYAIACDEKLQKFKDSMSFKVRAMKYDGTIHKGIGPDSTVLALMNFKGSGIKVTLKELRLQFYKHQKEWWQALSNDEEVFSHMDIFEFAVKNNFNIKFNKGDIKMRVTKNNNGIAS